MQWEKGRVLGHGGSSIVYECFITDTTGTTGTTATTKGAVKEINKSGLSVQQLKVIEAEIDLLRALTHPNVVQYLGTEYTSTHFYIFMEEASCGSLRQLYTTHGALNESMIKYFLQQVLRGLYYLHLKGVAHRDIKAANILITYDGIAKLADFGSSKKLIMESLISGIKGTPHFMAPEVIKGTQAITGWYKSDIWSIGCLAIELHTANLPFSKYENSMTVMFKVASGERPEVDRDSCSTELFDFITICNAAEPSQRPSVEDLLAHSFLSGKVSTSELSYILKIISTDEDSSSYTSNEYDSTLGNNELKSIPVINDNVGNEIDDDATVVVCETIKPNLGKVTPEKLVHSAEDDSQHASQLNESKAKPKAEALQVALKPIEKADKKSTNKLKEVHVSSNDHLRGSFALGQQNASPSLVSESQKPSTLRQSSRAELGYSEMERPRAPLTGEILRLGQSSSEALLKVSTNGVAAIRRHAREELEKGSQIPIRNRAKRSNSTTVLSSSFSARSHSADINPNKARVLPPLLQNAASTILANATQTRAVQSAPTTTTSLSLAHVSLLPSSQTPNNMSKKSFSFSRSSISTDVVLETDEAEIE